jgi:ParB-like nuclease domain
MATTAKKVVPPKKASPVAAVPGDLKKMREVDIDNLHLDLENPRLPESVAKTPKAVLTWIARSTAIEDLMSAIATNGFFPGEPVVVYPRPNHEGEYIVIEGNRRLTACKLIHNPQECEKPTTQMIQIAETAAHKPKKIPVVVADTRSEVLPYLGFRHITGIKEWDPLAKARYLKQLFDTTSAKQEVGERYLGVAKSIGSRRDHVKRNLDALAVYQVMEANDFFQIQGLGEESIKFAVLSTALADERIGEFVGIVKKSGVGKNSTKQPTNPILDKSAIAKKPVEELSRWLFEKKDGKTVVGESRNLRELAAVIESPKALQALRSKSSLSYAYRLTSGVNHDFMQHMYTALTALEAAAALVANVSYKPEAFSLAMELSNLVKQIGKTLRDKQTGQEDEF